MSDITLTVNGRNYEVRCDDGQEPHVRALAGDVDRRVGLLTRSLGPARDQVDEARLLLLAALLIADELHRAPTGDALDRLAAEVNALAARIETVAGRLADP